MDIAPEEQEVVDLLGQSGEAVVKLVRAQLKANADELRDLANHFNVKMAEQSECSAALLQSVRDALDKALQAHRDAASAANVGQSSPGLASAAMAATSAAKSRFHDWDAWRESVDTKLSELDQAVFPKHSGAATVVNRVVINPVQWSLFAWLLAYLGAFVGFVVAASIPEQFGQAAPTLLRTVVVWLLPVLFGFFAGGTVGSLIDYSRSSRQDA